MGARSGAGAPAGHGVLQVPVPQLDAFVRGRIAHYDAAYLSDDPTLVQAHVTALGPFLPDPAPADLDAVARVAAATPAFDFTLAGLDVLLEGMIVLRPDPDEPFAALTRRLVEVFPQCPPYAGRYTQLVPHLSLDQLSVQVDLSGTRERLGDVLPARCRADRLDLAWYEPGRCRRLASWALGPARLSTASCGPAAAPGP